MKTPEVALIPSRFHILDRNSLAKKAQRTNLRTYEQNNGRKHSLIIWKLFFLSAFECVLVHLTVFRAGSSGQMRVLHAWKHFAHISKKKKRKRKIPSGGKKNGNWALRLDRSFIPKLCFSLSIRHVNQKKQNIFQSDMRGHYRVWQNSSSWNYVFWWEEN